VVASLAVLPATALGQSPGRQQSADEWIYTVRPGDTLWSVSGEFLESTANWPSLQKLNRVAEPTRLAPGTRLRIPFALMKKRPAPARAVEQRGRVELWRAGTTKSEPLESGASLNAGDALVTGPDASVAVEFADGSRVVLGANARMTFDALSAFGSTGMVDTQLRLERGRARSQVTPRRGRFRIWTPAAATVVRGTEFRAAFEPEAKAALIEVTAGTVEASAAGATVGIAEGFGTRATEGAPPEAPVSLLPAPAVGWEPRFMERLPLRIVVPPVPGAVAYHLELAPDDRFLVLAYEGTSATGEFRAGNLTDGVYALRLRAVDARGLQGLDAISTLTLNARPEPPVLLEPAEGAVVRAPRVAFNWSRPAGATAYRFQLAREGATATPLVDTTHAATGPLVVEPTLAPGGYAWRVATRADDDEGPFGDWQSFTRRESPPAPQAEPPRAEAGRVRFAWPRGGDGSTYRLQVARDAAFSDVVVDTVTPTPASTFENPAPGTYYLRVKTIEADGFEGDFGPPQSFEVAAGVPPPRPKRRFPWGEVLAPLVPLILGLIAV
jgi:hypothetical protein